jgi:alginate O-acetyltransferase complex protein AlgI
MQFNSFLFFIFFPIVVLIYYLTPQKLRWAILLLASCIFYMAFSVNYLLVILSISVINYFIGLGIVSGDGRIRKSLYISGIVLNLLILAFFKYWDFLLGDIQGIARFLHLGYPANFIRVILPLGLSFFTFSSISYLIDIKRKPFAPEEHIGVLTSYFLFFPKLLQGPIERAGRVIPQFRQQHSFSYENGVEGLKLMAWGFFKKLVIADRLATFVNDVYAHPGDLHGSVLIIATFFFAFQIYADFSGYTDIALGSAKILGFDILQNFRRPYLAVTIRDFWNRWHISLSQWLRDYLFLPTAYFVSGKLKKTHYLGVKTDKWIYLFATFFTFILCGIWHGVGWTYFTWGALFAFYLSFGMLTDKFRKRMNRKSGLTKRVSLFRLIQVITTFALVLIAWVFFRAASVSQALIIVRNIFRGWSIPVLLPDIKSLTSHGLSQTDLAIAFAAIGLLISVDVLSEKKEIWQRIAEKSVFIRWGIYYLLIISILVFGIFENRQFIYLQF